VPQTDADGFLNINIEPDVSVEVVDTKRRSFREDPLIQGDQVSEALEAGRVLGDASRPEQEGKHGRIGKP
jgi:hypothetical protein